MRLYGRPEKRSMSQSFASEETTRHKRLITDYFTMNRENTCPHSVARLEPPVMSDSNTDKPRSQQTYLDLGQRDFFFKECKECGMKYDTSFPSETRLHQRFHKFHTTGMVVKVDKADLIGRWGEYVLFLVSRQRREEIMELVNNELNAVDLYGDEIVYGMVDKENKLSSVAIIDPHPVLLQISRIWTRKDLRRKGLAGKLLEEILKYERKSKREIKFSSPTDAGFSFAKSFIAGDDGGGEVQVYTNR